MNGGLWALLRELVVLLQQWLWRHDQQQKTQHQVQQQAQLDADIEAIRQDPNAAWNQQFGGVQPATTSEPEADLTGDGDEQAH